MRTLRTLIVDDEPLALGLLKAKLSKVAEIEIVAQCKNGREAIQAIMDHSPDLVFLDIQMPGIDGFEVIKKLQTDVVPLIVFTTAYEQYALDAFDVHAVDYILKPIDDERIQRALKRAQERLESGDTDGAKNRIMGAIGAISQIEREAEPTDKPQDNRQSAADNLERKIVIKDRDEITLLTQSSIKWIDAAGDYCCIHADGETFIKRSTLKDLLEELEPNSFKRVHRSTIVNLNFIEKVIPHTKGEFFLVLGEHEKVKVSRNYREVIKAFLSH